MADPKNRAEHDYVVQFIREVFRRTCYDVDVPAEPGILPLTHVQHLCTPARARILEGVDLWTMKDVYKRQMLYKLEVPVLLDDEV